MLKIKLTDIDNLSKNIVDELILDNFHPDAIIYIEKAGLLLGRAIAEKLNINIISCQASRPLSTLKKRSTKILTFLPQVIIEKLRRIEVDFGLYKISKERNVIINTKLQNYKKFLIVDDSLDTGYTIYEVVKKVLESGIDKKDIRIAVINVLSEKKLKPVILPDYTIYKNIHIQYPWSADSGEFKNYKKIYLAYKNNTNNSL